MQERAAGADTEPAATLTPAHGEWFKKVKVKEAAVPMHYGTKVLGLFL